MKQLFSLVLLSLLLLGLKSKGYKKKKKNEKKYTKLFFLELKERSLKTMRTDFIAWKWLPFPLEEKDGKQCFYLCFLIKTVSASLSVLCGDTACEVIKKNVI